MKAKELIMEGYIAFELDKKSRSKLMSIFPPKYPDVIAHHITYKFGVSSNDKIPSNPESNAVIGYIDDGDGLEALVDQVNGKTTRPDGKIYHITWSLDREKGKKPVHSNNLLMSKEYEPIDPINIDLKSNFFK